MSSTMNSDEGTPVDNEVVADAVGTELTVPRREQNQINIHKFEREMAAAGTVMEDREMIAIRDAEQVRSLLLGAPNPNPNPNSALWHPTPRPIRHATAPLLNPSGRGI